MTGIPQAAIDAAAEVMPGLTREHAIQVATEVLEAAAPHIAAAEREAIIQLAAQLHAWIPADHPAGAQASFADYLRVTVSAGSEPCADIRPDNQDQT